MFSGSTVEINNTDAEGRLVLADGCAWAAATFKVQSHVDEFTLCSSLVHIDIAKLDAILVVVCWLALYAGYRNARFA